MLQKLKNNPNQMNITIDNINEEEKNILTKILDNNIPFELKQNVESIFYNKTVPLKYAIKRGMLEYALLYHQRLCEDAGKELPSEALIDEQFSNTHFSKTNGTAQDAARWVKKEASTLLAAKQGEIERLRKGLSNKSELPTEYQVGNKIMSLSHKWNNNSEDISMHEKVTLILNEYMGWVIAVVEQNKAEQLKSK